MYLCLFLCWHLYVNILLACQHLPRGRSLLLAIMGPAHDQAEVNSKGPAFVSVFMLVIRKSSLYMFLFRYRRSTVTVITVKYLAS